MPLARDALDQLIEALHEQLVQRLASERDDPHEHAAWRDRCVEVIRGFADIADRAYVDARLDACPAQPVQGARGAERQA